MAKIVMVGPTGVGKTSLLAAMYPQLQTKINLEPKEEPRQILDDLRSDLKQLGEGGIKIESLVIEGSRSVVTFDFDVKHEQKTDMSLKIVDMPGSYYKVNNGQQAIDELHEADVSFWCIDSVALMENNGEYHEQINSPSAIVNCYTNSKLNENHSICVVLMRSETYEQNNRIAELFQRFKNLYTESIENVKESLHGSEIYYCPVQTTGNLRFNNYERRDGDFYYPIFIRHSQLEYQPQGCEAPVLCAIKRSLEVGTDRVLADIERIIDEYPPFVRWSSWIPGHAEYKAKLETAKRLDDMLKNKINPEIESLLNASDENKRFFKW